MFAARSISAPSARFACVFAIATAPLALLGACEGPSLSFDVKLPEPTEIVTLESNLLASASGMAIDSAGRLWIADFGGKRLVSVRGDGTDPRSVGREGRGPGELLGPLGIVAGPTFVRVAEAFNNRLQDYSLDGSYLTQHAADVPMIGGAALHPKGHFVTPKQYGDSNLASIHYIDDADGVAIGRPVTPWVAYRSADVQRLDAQEGRVPPEMRNAVITAVGTDAAYLLLIGEGDVAAFNIDGTPRWRTHLDVPEIEAATERFFKAARQPTDSLFEPLVLMTQASEVGEGLWVLVSGSGNSRTIIYVLDRASGRPVGRISIPTQAPALKFVVDEAEATIYLSVPAMASIARTSAVEVPERYR